MGALMRCSLLALIPILILLSHRTESQRTRLRNSMSDSVLRAIEMTKRRQSADREPAPPTLTASAVRRKAARPVRTHPLDVERMNLLIKTLDKAWAMPKLNSREPIGSNFQYKKTCASIYKARFGACQQSGFGIMCFNYCYEQGESLEYKCEDLSDASYCKSNGHYDEFLTKYRKDAYRAKAYLHQMISRCYATAVCNADTGILNSTLVMRATGGAAHSNSRPASDPNVRPMPASTAQALKGLVPPPSSKSGMARRARPHGSSAQQVWDRYGSRGGAGGRRRNSDDGARDRKEDRLPRRPLNGLHPHEAAEEAESGEHVTPKYVPYWRKLLVRKRTTTTPLTSSTTPSTTYAPALPNAVDDSLDEWEIEELEQRMLISETPTAAVNGGMSLRRLVEAKGIEGLTNADHERDYAGRRSIRRLLPLSAEAVTGSTTATEQPNISRRHGWKPLKPVVLTPSASDSSPWLQQQELRQRHQSIFGGGDFAATMDEQLQQPLVGFWNTFQPGRWYHSIHYMTNTG